MELQLLREDGRPAAGALVSVAGAPVPMPDLGWVADEGGAVSIDTPAPGRYVLSVWLDGAARQAAFDVPGPAAGGGTRVLRLVG